MRKNRLEKEKQTTRKALADLLNIPPRMKLSKRGPEGEVLTEPIPGQDGYRSLVTGPEEALTDDQRRAPSLLLAQQFIDTHGALRPSADPFFAQYEVLEYAHRFRQVWA